MRSLRDGNSGIKVYGKRQFTPVDTLSNQGKFVGQAEVTQASDPLQGVILFLEVIWQILSRYVPVYCVVHGGNVGNDYLGIFYNDYLLTSIYKA